MSIYSRSYMRHDPTAPSGRPWALKGILIALLVVFLIQNIFRHWLGSSFLEENFALSSYQLMRGWAHTLLTYGFLHSTSGPPWHLVFNGLMLWWLGREVEGRLGSERFLESFLLAVLTGGIIWVCIHVITAKPSIVLGASAGVFGVLYLFCHYHWHNSLSLLFLPIRITGQQLFWIFFGFQVFFLLFNEIPGTGSSTAYSAHLGGMLGAFLYERYLLPRRTLISRFRGLSSKQTLAAPAWRKRAEAAKSKTGRFSVNFTDKKKLKSEVDRILDKINSKGFGALSEEEKRTLDKAKDIL
ncbi:MAG: rhomboid family intramembrane serine protease [Puniceicoccaceae bacterium]